MTYYLIINTENNQVAACSDNEKKIDYASRNFFDRSFFKKVVLDLERFGLVR